LVLILFMFLICLFWILTWMDNGEKLFQDCLACSMCSVKSSILIARNLCQSPAVLFLWIFYLAIQVKLVLPWSPSPSDHFQRCRKLHPYLFFT
jgi:hypothetical protein